MSQTETWTVQRLLQWTTDYLKQRGAESPRLDAEVLLAHARSCRRIELYTAYDEEVDDLVRATFRGLVKRRAEGVPVAYLVGHREFYSLSFRVTPDVLIPRPETEFLVIAALDRLKQLAAAASTEADRPPQVVDVGTGSGCIAVAIAKHAPAAQVTAVDVSEAALKIARENAATHGVADRVRFLHSDLLSALPAEEQFDLVVSNPPYVSEAEMADVSPEVKDHEPRGALVAGPTGTEVIEQLVPQAAERLRPEGWLLMEISPMIEQRVTQLVTADGRFYAVATVKDLSGLARVITARRTATPAAAR